MTGGPGDKQQLGKIALKQKLVAPNAIEEMLAHPSQGRGGQQGSLDRIKALSEQYGVPGIDLSQVVVPLENLKLIPHDIARQYGILPIVVKGDQLMLAMTSPGDRRPIDEIEFVTGRRVHAYVARATSGASGGEAPRRGRNLEEDAERGVDRAAALEERDGGAQVDLGVEGEHEGGFVVVACVEQLLDPPAGHVARGAGIGCGEGVRAHARSELGRRKRSMRATLRLCAAAAAKGFR